MSCSTRRWAPPGMTHLVPQLSAGVTHLQGPRLHSCHAVDMQVLLGIVHSQLRNRVYLNVFRLSCGQHGELQEQLPACSCGYRACKLSALSCGQAYLLWLQVLGNTVNGTTYVGRRARTTGAPQNHWFGPAGDPRGAGIGTPEAIRLVWSCHREIIHDFGPTPTDMSALKTT